MANTERLGKLIARSGRASRREAERLIVEGKVEVNGEVVLHPGHPVDPDRDKIRVEGKGLPAFAPFVYYLLNKPKGFITTRNDPEGRDNVVQLVSHLGVRVEPVGRLDINTEGALLFTNDGELAHKLTHPSSNVPKRYVAKVWRVPDEATLDRVRNGVYLEDGRSAPCKVRVLSSTDGGNAWLEITVTEGKNHLIRRLLAAVGHPVSKLRRESFATITARNMERGELRDLSPEEIARLRDIAAGLTPSEAGHKSKYKPGFARPKSDGPKPLHKKKAARKRATRESERGAKGG